MPSPERTSCIKAANSGLKASSSGTTLSAQKQHKDPRRPFVAGGTAATSSVNSPAVRRASRSPLRGASTKNNVETAKHDVNCGSSSCAAQSGRCHHGCGCEGPLRLPYHEALQMAYGPPVAPIVKTNLDLAALARPAHADGVSTYSGRCAGRKPLPGCHCSSCGAGAAVQQQIEAAGNSTAGGAAAAAVVMGAAVAAAAATLVTSRSRCCTPEPQASPNMLQGYTNGYIDGRLAAMHAPDATTGAGSPAAPAQLQASFQPCSEPTSPRRQYSPAAHIAGSMPVASAAISSSPAAEPVCSASRQTVGVRIQYKTVLLWKTHMAL